MNLNELARIITLREKGNKQVSIAQIKEIMKILFEEMSTWEPVELFKVLKRYE